MKGGELTLVMATLRRLALPLLIVLVAVIQAKALQCYVCDDCQSGYDNTVTTCQAPDTGGNNTESGSAESTGNGGGGLNTTPSSEDGSTTPVQDGGAGGVGTTPSPADGGVGGGSTTPSSEDGGAGDANTTPGLEDGGASGGSTTPSSEDGGAGGGSTTQISEDGDAVGGSTTPSSEDGGAGGENTTSNSEDGGAGGGSIILSSVDGSVISSLEDQNVKGQLRIRRFVGQFRANSTPAWCVIASYEESGITKLKRGCSYGENVNDETRCRNLVSGNFNGTLGRCNVCERDKCNSATKSAVAFGPFLVGIIISYL